jgi:hypothetical protein
MALSGAAPALVLAFGSVLAAILLGLVHRRRDSRKTEDAVDRLVADDDASGHVFVPPQEPAPAAEQWKPLVRDILPGR